MTPDSLTVVKTLYDAMAAHNGQAMAECYAEEATFSDAVFVGLKGSEIGGMWTMLCGRAHDMVVTYKILEQSPGQIKVAWDASYTFTKTKRKVHNIISATIQVRDGKIIDHRDHFDFWRWSRQAFGPAGLLLGWTAFFKGKVRSEARANLHAYMSKRQKA